MVKFTNNSLFQETNKFAMYNELFTKMRQNEMSYIIWTEKEKFCNINYFGILEVLWSYLCKFKE